MDFEKLVSLVRKCVTEYKMIRDGDKIAVGLSGGKDSLALLSFLASYKKYSPEKFDLIAITVDLSFTGAKTDYTPLKEFCDKIGVPFILEKTEIGEIVFDVRKEKSPCALCSKMRKGALYSACVREGANKVALGHHRDDMLDTFLLSLFYEGRLNTFAPKSYLDKTKLTLIRPMLYVKESDLKGYAKNLPVVESNCPVNKLTKREDIKTAVKELSKSIPNIREMMFTALTHPDRYNLFDRFMREIDEF